MSVEVFVLYCLLLVVSGIIMLVSAIGGFGQRPGARIAEALFGAGFLGYGVYLIFFYTGGDFVLFYYAFVAPILTVAHVVTALRRSAQPPGQPQPPFQPYQPPRYREFGTGAGHPLPPAPPMPSFAAQPPMAAEPPMVAEPPALARALMTPVPPPPGAPLTLPLGFPPPARPQVSRTGPSTSL